MNRGMSLDDYRKGQRRLQPEDQLSPANAARFRLGVVQGTVRKLVNLARRLDAVEAERR